MSAKKTTKPGRSSLNRREAMRAQRIAEARRQKLNRILLVIGIVLAVAIVASVIAVVATRQPTTPVVTPSATQQIDPPDGDSQRAWITVPSANTKDGALIVDIHTDYQCPICKAVEHAYATLFEQLSDRGDIVLRQHTRVFMDASLKNTWSVQAAIAAACVDVADNSKYAAYHNTIFENAPSSQNEGAGFTDDQLRNEFATDVGLNGAALTAFQTCYDTQATAQWVNDVESNNIAPIPSTAGFPRYLFGGMEPNTDSKGTCTGTVGAQIGVCGTPTIYVGGVALNISDMITASADGTTYDPLFPTADELLTYLQQATA